MPRPVRPLLALTAAAALALGGCSSGDVTGPAQAPGEGEDGTVSAVTRAPQETTSVLAGTGAAELALGVSRQLFVAAPVTVLAAADDISAQARAASLAVSLAVPLLLTGADASDTSVGDELERLATESVLVVDEGAVRWAETTTADVRVVRAPRDPARLGELTGVVPDAPSEVPEPGLTGAVAALERGGRAVLQVDGAVQVEGAGTPATAEETSDDEPLPDIEPGDAVELVTVLTTGETAQAAAVATARAAGARVLLTPGADPRADGSVVRALAAGPGGQTLALGDAFGTPERLQARWDVAATGVELPGGGQVVFPGRLMVALYGHPDTPSLGVLGEQPLEETIERARRTAAEYESLAGVPVVPTFELITTIASDEPGADGDYSNEADVALLRPYVDAAREAGVYVVLDLQPGRTDFLTQAQRYTELLQQPHVGLALDPEWRLRPDERHLEQIGGVDAAEVNSVVTWLADLTAENLLPQKLLVLHQFRLSMLRDRDTIDTSRDELAVLVHGDGNGTPDLKLETWRALTESLPPAMWLGWKNFYDEDSPTFTPAQTLAVEPPPLFVSYQ